VYLLDHDLAIASKVKACVILCGGAILDACVEAVGARIVKRALVVGTSMHWRREYIRPEYYNSDGKMLDGSVQSYPMSGPHLLLIHGLLGAKNTPRA